MSRPELLSPAGSYDAVRAAVCAGADAVYLGGASFNARRRAKNLSDDELSRAVAYCHRYGVRVYVTFNILAADREMPEADEAIRLLARIGIDALIVQDLGLARRIRSIVPALPLHASTQMSIHNTEGAREARVLGFSRVVAARELTEADLRILCKDSPIEIETFAHGALCAAYSGQCYMSALIGRRSGNRGLCAQPCRMLYTSDGQTRPLMSLKELCMAEHLPALAEIGVACLKIEGRMRRPEYVALATAVYRKALDTGTPPTPDELARLRTMFSREGFTDGYFAARAVSKTATPGRVMFGTRTEAPDADMRRLCAQVKRIYRKDPAPRPLTVPPRTLGVYPGDKLPPNRKSRPKLTVSVRSLAQLTPGLLRAAPVCVYIPLEQADERITPYVKDGIPLAVTLPRVVLPTQIDDVCRMLTRAKELGVTTALAGNLGHLPLLRAYGYTIRGDYGLNAYNTQALVTLRELGLTSATLSYELRFAAMRDMGKPLPTEAIVYGHLPLMLFENCLIRADDGTCRCGKPRAITDRTGQSFLLLSAYGCRTELHNGIPLWLADRREDYSRLGLNTVRLQFTVETPEECTQVADAYIRGTPYTGEFTRGLYYRGVE